jgi:hypothetical protein
MANENQEKMQYPGLYSLAAQSAANQKNKYRTNKYVESWAILLAALTAAFSSYFTINYDYSALFRVIAFVVAIILFIRERKKGHREGWYHCRALAESVKAETWYYSMRLKPYESMDEEEEISRFSDNLSHMRNQRSIDSYMVVGGRNKSGTIREEMKACRSLNVDERYVYYIENRVQNQSLWYEDKASEYANKESVFYKYTLIALLGGVVVSILQFISMSINLGGFIATLVAVIVGWAQTWEFNRLSLAYKSASLDLEGILGKYEHKKPTESGLKKLIEESEAAISKEHQVWVNRA